MFGFPVTTYIQYCILKMWPPFLVFGPSWFLAPPAAKSWRRACSHPVHFCIIFLHFSAKAYSSSDNNFTSAGFTVNYKKMLIQITFKTNEYGKYD